MKLEKALEIEARCKGGDECAKCPLDKEVKIETTWAKMYVAGKVCSFVQVLRGAVETDEDGGKGAECT